jgi:hypothetical protein
LWGVTTHSRLPENYVHTYPYCPAERTKLLIFNLISYTNEAPKCEAMLQYKTHKAQIQLSNFEVFKKRIEKIDTKSNELNNDDL